MSTLRIVPHLRSSVLEERPPGQAVLYTSRRDDADAALLTAGADVRPFSWPRLLRALADPDLELLEVAEPLWLAEWVRALRYVLVLAVVRRVLPGRGKVAVGTYAIENLDPRERLRLPSLLAVAASLLLLDVVVFGTTGAHENYRRAFGWSLRRVEHAVMPPRLGPCAVCGPTDGPRDPTVLFLGAPSERKGFPVLLAAWASVGGHARGWRLVVADPVGAGVGTGEPALPPGVSVRHDPPRDEVHALLRSSAVVVLPSVRRPGWREQIGLPLVEGLAHGCRVVTTPETGLADTIADHPLVTLTTPGDPAGLADGLHRAMTADDDRTAAPPVGYTKADVVAWWLAATRR